jgi:hypothetical protein
MKANAVADRPGGPAMPGPSEFDLTSDRMEAKCAIFDATDTISGSCGNAIEKMKIFAANNHLRDLS